MEKIEENVIISEFADELRVEGINFKGYGIIPKYVMIDADLTLDAKAIYAYFCAYSGAGTTSFPSRSRILADLGMSKDAYYKHYNLLLTNGYIETTRAPSETGQFKKNIYTLVNAPKKFLSAAPENNLNKTFAIIRTSGLKSAGFGFIPKALMTDSRLSVKAKGLYAYYASFLGAGESVYPAQAILRSHLGISDNSCQKYSKELLSLNYIEIQQRHVNGRLAVNNVILIDNPNISAAQKQREIIVIEESDGKLQIPKKQDTVKQDLRKQDLKKSDTNNKQKEKKQIKKETIPTNQQQNAKITDGLMEISKKEEKIELPDKGDLLLNCLGNRSRVGKCLRVLTDFENRKEEAGPDIEPGSTYLLFLEALTDILCARKPMKLTEDQVTSADVLERLNRYIHYSFARGTLVLYDLEELVRESYEEGCRSQNVRNPLGYCKACIWTCLKTGDAAVRAQIARDLGY